MAGDSKLNGIEVVECGCCKMREECTEGYIGEVRERFCGMWVCGLCEEAIKDEQVRLGIGVEEALQLHGSQCERFAASKPSLRLASSILVLFKKIMASHAPIGASLGFEPKSNKDNVDS
ncbi:hypothetical protein AMTRI_Chr04g244200 [Amborella trichopoda]